MTSKTNRATADKVEAAIFRRPSGDIELRIMDILSPPQAPGIRITTELTARYLAKLIYDTDSLSAAAAHMDSISEGLRSLEKKGLVRRLPKQGPAEPLWCSTKQD